MNGKRRSVDRKCELAKLELKKMASDELTKELEQILKSTDRETQLKVFRALMRYQNIDGLDLEEVLSRSLTGGTQRKAPEQNPTNSDSPGA